jgi:methylmalonyl-CoA/ethylmalonyl-CoA epimerase
MRAEVDIDRHRSTIPLIAGAQGRPGQIGIVVEDMDRGLEDWGAAGHTGGGWRIWRYGPAMVSDMTYRGRRSDHSMWLAMSGTHPQVELIQPLEGRSIYVDWLQTHGPGLHHLGFYIDDVEATTAQMEEAGLEMVQSGRGMGADGTGGYAYFDTTHVLGYYVEAIQVPVLRREPHRVWPGEAT